MVSDDEAAACLGKARFRSYGAAAAAQGRLKYPRDRHRSGREPYRCKHCGGFHLGTVGFSINNKALGRYLRRYLVNERDVYRFEADSP